MDGIHAYFWAGLYFVMIVIEMTYGKKITAGIRFNSMWGAVMYTNLLSVVPMFLLGWAMGDYKKFDDNSFEWNLPAITMLVVSSVVGVLIGYTGWSCRALVTATSFTLIGVINKILTILLNVGIWDKHATPFGILALMVCLGGGSLYQQSGLRSASNATIVKEPSGKSSKEVEVQPLMLGSPSKSDKSSPREEVDDVGISAA